MFSFPSWYKGFSLATIEAAASGLPNLAASINGTSSLIEDAQKRMEMGKNVSALVEQNTLGSG